MTPFKDPLPIQVPIKPVTPDTLSPQWSPDPAKHQLGLGPDGKPFPASYYAAAKTYEIHVGDYRHVWHSDQLSLPGAHPQGSLMFGYEREGGGPGACYPGPLFVSRYGTPTMIRVHNDLNPDQINPFGMPEISTHLHNFHSASESDGNPLDFIGPGEYRDHLYNMFPAGHDLREQQNTLWYHDHDLDFTSQNVYRGLAGFHLVFDYPGTGGDSGDEKDPHPNAFRLPSGEFDIPMVFTDMLFLPNGETFFDLFNFDGHMGDRFAVNGKVNPYLNVKRRKYRFRYLDGGPSRWYHLALYDGKNLVAGQVIANDGNILEAPLSMNGVTLSVAERFDVVFDFSQFQAGDKLYIINRMEQKDGRGPTGKLLAPKESTKIMEIRVTGGAVADPSRVPAKLREQPDINLNEVVARRKFKFDRTNGAWAVNGQFYNGTIDESRPSIFSAVVNQAVPTKGTAEIWELEGSGGWGHPVHIHFEEGRILSRNGKTPPPHERGRKDVYALLGSEKVEVFLRFRDYVGKYVCHCHNTVHEDHAMMFNWTIQDGSQNQRDT